MAITDQSLVKISGAPSAGEQAVAALPDLTELNEKLEEVIAGTVTEVGATTADWLLYVDDTTKAVEATQVNSMFDEAISLAIDSGSGASIVTSGTPTALAIFDTDFYSSSPAITDTAGDLGITLLIPSRFKIAVTASIASGQGNDFQFQVYVGGVACGRITTATGDGTTKDINFAIQCISQTVTPGDTVELRVSNGGETLNSITADMFVEFAGL
jgi:hypothetical protein